MEKHTDTFYRRSPVTVEDRPKKVELINGFEVALEYEDEPQKKGPALIDLSHLPKWDIQGSDLSRITVNGQNLPTIPGECRIQNESVLFRMNRTQAGIWHLCQGDAPELPDDPGYTDVTDAWALFGLAGDAIPALFEQITDLDLMSPSHPAPMFIQGPVFDVYSRIVLISRTENSATALIACSRGFGQSMAEALLETGSAIGLHIAGVNAFFNSLAE